MARNGLTTKQLEAIAHRLGVSVPELFASTSPAPTAERQ